MNGGLVHSGTHAARRTPCASLLLGLLAVAFFLSTDATHALQFDRSAIGAGQFWRVVTGHWTHWSVDHLIWDVLAFVVLGVLCERIHRTATLSCILVSAIAISAVVWFTNPTMTHYRGLSGVDSALLLLLAVLTTHRAIRTRQRPTAAIVIALTLAFVAKVALESATGTAIFVSQQAGNFTVVPAAHMVGALVGLGVGCTTFGRPEYDRDCSLVA